MRLSSVQIARYREQGFLRLESLATDDELVWVSQVYDRLFDTQAGREAGDQFDLAGTDEDDRPARLPQLMNPAKYAPELNQAQFRLRAAAIARQLLGDEAVPGDEHAICKPARDGVATPWHQDEAYWDPAFDYNDLSIWMPLQEVTSEGGCLQFIPTSHLAGIVSHQSIGEDARVHGLETAKPVDATRAVACPLPAGGCTVHQCRTLHYAGMNTTDVRRRAYIMTFRLNPTPRLESREFPWLTRRRTKREARARRAGGSP